MSRHRQVNGVLRHVAGYRPDRKDHRDLRMGAQHVAAPLPPAASLRDRCPPVLDQGSLGTCVTHGTTEAMAFLEGKAQADKFFSRLWIYAKTRKMEGVPLTEDSGLQIRDAVKVAATLGVPYEDSWTYEDIEHKFSIDPPDKLLTEAAKHKALFYYSVPDLFTLKASISQGFPVIFGFPFPESAYDGQTSVTGEFKLPSPSEGFDGGHCMLVAEYDDAKRIVKGPNSWGTGWGDKGWFTLSYDWWDAGLVSDMWTIRSVPL